MSPREKKLLIFFVGAGFLLLNLFGFKWFMSQRLRGEGQLAEARQKLETAELYRESQAQVNDQIEWLAKHEPAPAASQDVLTQLQQLCEKEAQAAGLTLKAQKPLPADSTEGRQFHRAKFQITVSGREEALYRWFDRVNQPDQFRAVTAIRLSPNPKDDTQIDCTATFDQWFVPLPPA